MGARPPLVWLLSRSFAAGMDALAPAPALPPSPRPAQPAQILLFSQVIWPHVWGRPQEIAERLSRHVPVHFLGPVPVNRLLEARDRWQRREVRCGGRLAVHSPAVLPGEYRLSAVRRFNAFHVCRLIRRLGIAPEATVLFTNNPFVPEVLERFPWGLAVFDWMDDFAGFAWAPRRARALERRTLSHADLFTSGTDFLARTRAAECGEIAFVPNGVRFEAFAAEDLERPPDLPTGFDHVVGYIGTLSDRLDTALVEALARALPRAAVVLIGPVHGSLGRPPAGANVFLPGMRPHHALPAYVRHFDAGLIPFRTGPGAEAVNPTKLLEYAAAGVPVIATALPDVERLFADCVAIARTPEEFIAHTRRALAGGMRAEVERARARAREASWDAMADRLWELIAHSWQSGPRRRTGRA